MPGILYTGISISDEAANFTSTKMETVGSSANCWYEDYCDLQCDTTLLHST